MLAVMCGVTGQPVYKDFICIQRVSAPDLIIAPLAEEHVKIEVRFYQEPETPGPLIGIVVRFAPDDDEIADFVDLRWLESPQEALGLLEGLQTGADNTMGVYLFDHASLRYLQLVRRGS